MRKAETVDGEPAWRTAFGELMLIKDMDDDHLRNAIRMVQRQHDEFILTSCGTVGTVANDCADDTVFECDAAGPEFTCHRAYPRLLEEALKRGLKMDMR